MLTGGIAALISVAIYGGAHLYYQSQRANETRFLDRPVAAGSESEPAQLLRASESFRLVAKKVGPSVLNIKTTKKARPQGLMQRRGGGAPGFEEMPDPLFDFFGFGAPFQSPQHEAPQQSLGSGILIDKNGHVVTNNHVVDEADEIVVTLADQKTDIKAKIVGTDSKTDLAVLKLESLNGLPEHAEWADSEKVEVGDWAIAVGSPFALGQSVTVGIVSAKGNRNSLALTGAEFGGDLLQTDAAINPGNSGGPLCDLNGRVMGVNTAIYTRSGGYMGIGFAIPSNLAKGVVEKLIKDGKVIRGWLGVYIQPLEPDLAKDLGITGGVSIHEVVEGSPAATAGLNAGDIVVEVGGTKVTEVTALQKIISNFKPGEKVSLKVVSYDNKQAKEVTVKIGELPDTTPGSKEDTAVPSQPDKLGLIVGMGKNRGEVVVQRVLPGGLAEGFGIQPGDVLVSINRKKVDSVQTYQKYLDGSKRIYLQLRRKGRMLFYQFQNPGK